MKEKLILAAILVLSALIRIYLITFYSVPFAADMGRDLLWSKDISFYHIPTLIGPAGSIWGVYFGPFWFYLLSVPLWLTQGNPLSAVYTTCLIILACGLLSYIFFKNYLGKKYIYILPIIILFNANLISVSTFAFHANVLPTLTLLMIYFCFLAVIKSPYYLSLSFFAVSLMFHADPAPAVVFSFVPFCCFFVFKLYKNKKILKIICLSTVAYLIPFLPQILFELRNNFTQTRSLISYISGNNPSLSGQLPFLERIPNRFAVYFDFIKSGFAGNNNLLAITLFVLVIYGLFKFLKNEKDYKALVLYKISALAFITSFLIFSLIITVEIKGWYLFGISTIVALLIFFALIGLKNRIIVVLFLCLFVSVNCIHILNIKANQSVKHDPALLSNQLNAISLIYNLSQNEPFSVYVFTPSIYDYNYQYLFWWIGNIKNKDLPEDFAYLPEKPDYVRNKSIYAKDGKVSKTVFLIIEQTKENPYYTSSNWLKNFDDYKLVWEHDINQAVKIQKRIK